jgi:hypothetical protein
MSEELIELKTRIGDINKTVGEMKALMALRDTNATDLKAKVDLIYEFLIGSTDSNKPSLMLRMDRLEQTNEARKWVWVTVAGLVINAAWSWLKK